MIVLTNIDTGVQVNCDAQIKILKDTTLFTGLEFTQISLDMTTEEYERIKPVIDTFKNVTVRVLFDDIEVLIHKFNFVISNEGWLILYGEEFIWEN